MEGMRLHPACHQVCQLLAGVIKACRATFWMLRRDTPQKGKTPFLLDAACGSLHGQQTLDAIADSSCPLCHIVRAFL